MSSKKIKITLKGYRKPGELSFKDGRIFFKGFGYWPALNAEIKTMEGHKYHGFEEPPRKIWSVKDSPRNKFQIDYLIGNNPYAHYDKKLEELQFTRPLYDHQKEMVSFCLTRKQCIIAAEQGTGKTLMAIEIMERLGLTSDEVWYVGPKSGIKAVRRELVKWKSKVYPCKMLTYSGLVGVMRKWGDAPAPKLVIFDECSKIKTHTSQRSQAAQALADAIRLEHDGYVILMSGTPAPKAPPDWWKPCEVACPGFIKEGDVHKFKKRMCLTEQRPSITGGVYPHLITWLDDENKCFKCGELEASKNHDPSNIINNSFHSWKKSVNEVLYLYKRMEGLVLPIFKKDCLDLPEKQYRIIKVKPTVDLLNAVKLIKATSTRAIEALSSIRELSDGFQYVEEASSVKECPTCKGEKELTIRVPKEEIDIFAPNTSVKEEDFEQKIVSCQYCSGRGTITNYVRTTQVVGSPKDDVFLELLDDHEEVGRFIVWGGFKGTIDRLVEMCHTHGWTTLRVDGRGYVAQSPKGDSIDSDLMLDVMDLSHHNRLQLLRLYPKVCFVGHPRAGGMGLTLTSSPTELFYSNDFSGEARMQAEDRFHRVGMDMNRAATIIDLIMFPTDLLVLNNLRKKKKLQNLTMGQLNDAFTEEQTDEDKTKARTSTGEETGEEQDREPLPPTRLEDPTDEGTSD